MKRIIGLIAIILLTGNTFAQNISQNEIPAVVLNSFQLKFPNAEDVSWKLVQKNYHIKFEVNNKFNELYLDYKGNALKFHQDLWGSEVPEKVISTIKSRVKFFDLNDADLIVEGKDIFYEINFEIDGKDHDFWISDKGKLLKYRKELKDSEVPESIINQINTTYGTIDLDESKYLEDGATTYIIRGKINDMKHIFTVDKNSTVLQHKQDLRDNEIPNLIKKTLKESYHDYDIRDADLTEEAGKSTYLLKIKKSRNTIYVTFSPEGKVLEVK